MDLLHSMPSLMDEHCETQIEKATWPHSSCPVTNNGNAMLCELVQHQALF